MLSIQSKNIEHIESVEHDSRVNEQTDTEVELWANPHYSKDEDVELWVETPFPGVSKS